MRQTPDELAGGAPPHSADKPHRSLTRRRLAQGALAGVLSAAGLRFEGQPSSPADRKPATRRPSPELVYTSPSGIAFRVSADGLSSVRIAGREIANGSWFAASAEKLFGM